MPTATYIALANTTLSSTASTVTFSSIPATYRDLVLVIEGPTSTGDYYRVRFNGDSGTNYPAVIAEGDGSATGSVSFTVSGIYLSDVPTSNRMLFISNIFDYSATDKHKTVLTRYQRGSIVGMNAARWANTSAVTSMVIAINNGTAMPIGSSFALYGIVS